jgi:tetratricopeptide (TPR) repeat protein
MPLSDIEKIKKYTVSPYYATNTQQSGYQLTLTSEDVAEASKLFDEGKYEEAIKIYKKGENHPDEDFRSSVNVCIANSYKAMKKYAEAVEAYKKVTSENNQTANYYLVFGQSLYLSGSPEEGIKMLRKSAEMGSEDAKESLKIIAKNTQGTETRLTADEWKQVSNLVKEDKYAEAIKILKKDENDPDEEYRSMINCYIGQQYFSMKKYKEAAEAYQKVSSEKYQDADYYYFLGFSLKKSKKKEEAKKALLKAEEMGSELAKYELLAK